MLLISGLEHGRQSNVCLMFVKPNLGIEENQRGSIAGSGTLYHVSHLTAFPQLPFFVIVEKYILIQTVKNVSTLFFLCFDKRFIRPNAVLFHWKYVVENTRNYLLNSYEY